MSLMVQTLVQFILNCNLPMQNSNLPMQRSQQAKFQIPVLP